MNNIITSLYEHYKDTPKKLKIICDWDEVIQAHEPYALWKSLQQNPKLKDKFDFTFEDLFEKFWQKDFPSSIVYSSFGSKLYTPKGSEEWDDNLEEVSEKQQAIKNSPNFYQEAPFLTIAEDLLKLIKEDKVEKLIFLSAYDKRKFPKGDERKYDIFKETFANLAHNWRVCREDINYRDDKCWGGEINRKNGYLDRINLHLIDFDTTTKDDLEKEKQEALNKFKKILEGGASLSEKLKQTRSLIDIGTMNLDKYEKPINRTKADWIEQNASDFDIVIDDNPNICKSLVEKEASQDNLDKILEKHTAFIAYRKNAELVEKIEQAQMLINNKIVDLSEKDKSLLREAMIEALRTPIKVLTPYYPAVAEQHHQSVLLVKNEVSDLKEEDFIK